MNHNGTVNSSTFTQFSFTAPSLPTDVFTDTVVITVTAIGTYGIGPVSERKTSMITGKIIFKVRMISQFGIS